MKLNRKQILLLLPLFLLSLVLDIAFLKYSINLMYAVEQTINHLESLKPKSLRNFVYGRIIIHLNIE